MNSFIFSFHPRGTSMERTMADAGYEVWSVNLRQQGDSRPCIKRSPPAPSMRAYAEVDLGAAIAWVVRKTQTTARTVTLIGCSLGGTISYAHMALTPSAQVGGIIAIGSPMRWESIPMLFKVALSSPRLAGMVPVMGSRAALRTLFPVLARVPGMLDIYLNASHVDVHAAGELTRTVEDPDPRVNREIARWLQTRDLIVRGVNVSEAAGKQRVPLLVVTSNRDGIVPTDTAMSGARTTSRPCRSATSRSGSPTPTCSSPTRRPSWCSSRSSAGWIDRLPREWLRGEVGRSVDSTVSPNRHSQLLVADGAGCHGRVCRGAQNGLPACGL
jgi:pimeloyl-ACP methyl ester carboxylesterase